MATSPRTEAGKALLHAFFADYEFNDGGKELTESILAIEAEARQSDISVAWERTQVLSHALERLIDLHREAIDAAHPFTPKDDRIEYRENIVRPFIDALGAK